MVLNMIVCVTYMIYIIYVYINFFMLSSLNLPHLLGKENIKFTSCFFMVVIKKL